MEKQIAFLCKLVEQYADIKINSDESKVLMAATEHAKFWSLSQFEFKGVKFYFRYFIYENDYRLSFETDRYLIDVYTHINENYPNDAIPSVEILNIETLPF